MATTKSIAQWHAKEPAFYYRPGAPLDTVKPDYTRGPRGADVRVTSQYFPNKIGFTAKCTILDEPKRYMDDPKNPTTLSVGGDDFIDFLGQIEAIIAPGMKEELRPAKKTNDFGESYTKTKVSDLNRLWKNDTERTETFPAREQQVIIMGTIKPYVVNGVWGLTTTIFQMQEL